MEQRLIAPILTLMLALLYSHTVIAQIATPQAVKKFYNGMEQMADCSSPAEIGELEMSMSKCFFGYENSGMNIPNDFKYIEIDANTISHNNDMLTSNNYINKLSSYVYKQKQLKPTVTITFSRKTGSLPTFEGRMCSEDAYVETIVYKKFSYQNGSNVEYKEFTDTVYTHIYQNMISVINNGLGHQNNNNNPAQLKIKAAQEYEAKNFKAAYEIFEKIIQIDSHDDEVLYRLALMTYYGKGCRTDRNKGRRYMEESYYRFGSYSSRANSVLRNWKYRNSL